MKTIGLIGGMSWESTLTYYQLLNTLTRQRLGQLHSAELLLWSYNFAEIEAMQANNDWQGAAKSMIDVAQKLEQAGADCIAICTNTMHKLANEVQQAIDIPLIHIADATAMSIQSQEVKKPLLLATAYTMEQHFYTGRLKDKHRIDVMLPNAEQRQAVHNIIYKELCQGLIQADSKAQYIDIVHSAITQGADGVIFGCTEVGLLINKSDFSVPVFDTTELHANAIIEYALS